MNRFAVPLEAQPKEKKQMGQETRKKKEAKGERRRMRVGSRKPLAL
jgi:hypothetical protein